MMNLDQPFIIIILCDFLNINELISLKLTNSNICKYINIEKKLNNHIRNILNKTHNAIKISKTINFNKTIFYRDLSNILMNTISNKKYYDLFIFNLDTISNNSKHLNNENKKNIYEIIKNEYIYHKNNKKKFKNLTIYDSFLSSVYYEFLF